MVTELVLLLSAIASGPPVDFVYFEGQPKHEIDVSFGLHGACKNGVSAFASVGVLLDGVKANGKDVKRQDSGPVFIDDSFELAVQPGPNFQFHMTLDRLVSEGSNPRYSFAFVVPGVPRTVDITYRIRCSDGSVSQPFVTRGRRFAVPQPRQVG